MDDSTSQSEEPLEEPVLTKLISSKEAALPLMQAWQLNNFDIQEDTAEEEISDRVEQAVKKQIEPELKKQTELLKKEAYDAAFQQGYEAGFSSGSNDGKLEAKEAEELAQKAIFEPKLEQVTQLISGLESPYQGIQEQILSELVDLSLHVANKVTALTVSEHKEWVLDAIQQAVQVLPDESTPFHVELHPDDIALLEALGGEQFSYQIKENPELTLGTCLVQQQHASVLNSWQERFNEVAEDLKSKVISINEKS